MISQSLGAIMSPNDGPCRWKDHPIAHISERTQQAHGCEMSSQLYQHLGPPTREKGNVGRLSVTVRIEGAAQRHEEICSGCRRGRKKRLPIS